MKHMAKQICLAAQGLLQKRRAKEEILTEKMLKAMAQKNYDPK